MSYKEPGTDSGRFDTMAVTLPYPVSVVLSQAHLHREIEEAGRLRADFDATALEELHLLKAVIMETWGLYGVAPAALPRRVPEGGSTTSGYYLAQDITMSRQSYAIHPDEVLYPNPETFNSKRWISGDWPVSHQANIGFSPFGTGRRTCLGIHLAGMELKTSCSGDFL